MFGVYQLHVAMHFSSKDGVLCVCTIAGPSPTHCNVWDRMTSVPHSLLALTTQEKVHGCAQGCLPVNFYGQGTSLFVELVQWRCPIQCLGGK
eukprot:3159629-Amphidinium_carterae.1